ncbi:hypothetical protein AS361_01520 [Myroides marinus]|uniref:N-6 DNA methylase n=1 Tax=Myroides marinus TaxID=703342 RepID=UPI000741F8CA|nr:N-6 DNA methylase [Myroides marinus]KUF41721.1 hypothetical protein AS361_01520 [Myroides marinus]
MNNNKISTVLQKYQISNLTFINLIIYILNYKYLIKELKNKEFILGQKNLYSQEFDLKTLIYKEDFLDKLNYNIQILKLNYPEISNLFNNKNCFDEHQFLFNTESSYKELLLEINDLIDTIDTVDTSKELDFWNKVIADLISYLGGYLKEERFINNYHSINKPTTSFLKTVLIELLKEDNSTNTLNIYNSNSESFGLWHDIKEIGSKNCNYSLNVLEDFRRDLIFFQCYINDVAFPNMIKRDILDSKQIQASKFTYDLSIGFINTRSLRYRNSNKLVSENIDIRADYELHSILLKTRKSVNEYILLFDLLLSVKKGGHALIFFSSQFFYLDLYNSELLKYLFNKGYIRSIINFPTSFLGRENTSEILLILKNEVTVKQDVYFFKLGNQFGKQNEFLNENLAKFREYFSTKKEEFGVSSLTTRKQISRSGFSLKIDLYVSDFRKKLNKTEFKNLRSLSYYLKPFEELNYKIQKLEFKNKVRLITSKFFREYYGDSTLEASDFSLNYLKEDNTSFNQVIKLEQEAIIIYSTSEKLRAFKCNASVDTPIYIAKDDLFVFSIKDNKRTLIDYLITEIENEYFKIQFKNNSSGNSLIRPVFREFLNLLIVMPLANEYHESFLEQKRIFEERKKNKDYDLITRLKLKETIDSLIEEQINQRQWILHDLRNNQLLKVKNQILKLFTIANLDKQKYEDFLLPKEEGSLYDAIVKLNNNVNELNSKIDQIWNTKEFSTTPKMINIISFLDNYMRNQDLIPSEKFSYDIDDYLIFIDDLKESDQEELVLTTLVDIDNLEQIFANIFSNINQHAAFSKEAPGKVKITLELNSGYVNIQILNTGTCIININKKNYFLLGGKAGVNAGSGYGGNIIQNLAIANGIEIDILIDQEELPENYIFGISLKLKLIE